MDQKLLIDTIRTMTVILGALTAGYCLRKSGRVSDRLATPVNRTALTWIQPLVICLALWAMKRPDARTLALPLFGVALIVAIWPLAALIARIAKLRREDAGAFVTSAMFSNVGFTYGTFVAFVLLGAQGAALGALYCVSFMPAMFTLGFFVSRRYSDEGGKGILESLAELVRDGKTRNPVLGIIAGLSLNLSGATPPSEASFIIDIAMPALTATFLLAIGLGLRLSAIRAYWRECALLHGVKFVVSPVVGLLLAYLFGYWQLPDHSSLQVVFIEAASPSAILSVIMADIFGLNRRLAGALWLTTNVTAVFLAPVILLIARAL